MMFEEWLKNNYPNMLHKIHAVFSVSDMESAYNAGRSELEKENALFKQRIMTLEEK